MRFAWDPDVVEAWDPTKNAVAKASGAANVLGGVEHNYDGDLTDVFTGNLFTKLAPVLDIAGGTYGVDVGLNPAGSGSFQYWEGVNNIGNILTNTTGKGFAVAKAYFHLKDGHTASEVTTNVIYPNPAAVDADTYPSGVDLTHPDGSKYRDIYFIGFPTPATAPTNVTISADPAGIVAGGSTTLTVSSDASQDGGTLSYAYTTGDNAPDAAAMAQLSFQPGKTFTVSPAADAKYWGVVKNAKGEGEEESAAYAASAAAAEVSVLQKLDAAAVTMTAPAADAAPAAATVDGGANYTAEGTVWAPAVSGSFAGDTAYTATVTLAAKTGYLFSDAAKSAVTLTGTDKTATNVSLVNGGAKLTFDVAFDKTGKTNAQLVAAAKTKVGAASYSANQKVTNPGTEGAADNTTVADVENAVKAALSGMSLEGVTTEVSNIQITKAATPGKPSNAAGENGAFTATVTIKASANAGVSDTQNITGVITAQAASKYHQNLAAVNTAKAAIESALTSKTIAQSDANSAAAVKTLLEAEIAKLDLNGVTATVGTPTGTAATAGQWDKKDGTNGTFAATVSLSKGTVDGSWTGSGDNDTDYKAGADTGALTVTVTATTFTAQKTKDGTVTATPGFEELQLRWTAPTANVPVKQYLLTVAGADGTAVAGYDKKDMAKATSATVTGLTNGTAYTVTVTSVFEGEGLLADATATATASPVAGDPMPITMDKAQKTEGNVATYTNGKVELTYNGSPIDFDAVRENFLVRLYAKPAAGFKFTGWARAATTGGDTPSLDDAESFSFEDTTITNSTANPLILKVSEASTITPTFAAVAADVVEGKPKLQNLTVTQPSGRRLIQEDMTAENYDSFDSKKTNYTVYLTGEETVVKLAPYFATDLYKLYYSFNGATDTEYTVTEAPAGSPDITRVGDDISLTLPAGTTPENVTLKLVPKDNTAGDVATLGTTYTVALQRVAGNPQMMLELDAAKATKLSYLSVRVRNAAFESGDFSINLTEKSVTPSGGGEAVANAGFASFADLGGAALAANTYDAATVCKNPSALISIDKYEITNGGKTLNVTLSSKDGTPVTFDDKGEILFKVALLQNDAAMENSLIDQDLLPTIEINEAGEKNTMSETFFSGGLDFAKTVPVEGTAIDEENRLVYLKVMDKYNITAFINARPNNKLVTFNIYDRMNDVNEKINDNAILLEAGGKLLYKTGDGAYRIEILSNGFLPYVKDGLKIEGGRLDLDSVALIAGDVDGNGVIDAADRTAIVKALDAAVSAEDGSCTIGDATYYADFNDDLKINAKDLGKVIRNIVATANP